MEKQYPIPIFKIQLVKESEVMGTIISSSECVVNMCAEQCFSDREQMTVVYLGTKNQPLGKSIVSVGSLNNSIIHPREVFKGALLSNACSIVLVHNHPSGDCTPSLEDDVITERIKAAGQLLGIKLLDHVIVGPDDCYYSYTDEGKVVT